MPPTVYDIMTKRRVPMIDPLPDDESTNKTDFLTTNTLKPIKKEIKKRGPYKGLSETLECELCNKYEIRGYNRNSNMKRHKKTCEKLKIPKIPKIPETLHCEFCNKEFSGPWRNGNMKQHIKSKTCQKPKIPEILECDQCTYTCNGPNRNGNMKIHKSRAHVFEGEWHPCDYTNCDKTFKTAQELKIHKARRHDIEVEWHPCDYPGCDKKCKTAAELKSHKAYRHDIGFEWKYCDISNCKEKFKIKSDLTKHIRKYHTEQYNARQKVQEEKVRIMLLSNNFKEFDMSEAMPPIGYFKREKQINLSCAKIKNKKFARIDFIIATQDGNGYIFLEVDENQHEYGYDSSISCDMKRMAQVKESLSMECLGENREVPFIYWLRYNPNAWHINGELQHVPKEVRQTRLVEWIKSFRTESYIGSMRIGYAFYDLNEDGALEVVCNENYNQTFASMVDNLRGIK